MGFIFRKVRFFVTMFAEPLISIYPCFKFDPRNFDLVGWRLEYTGLSREYWPNLSTYFSDAFQPPGRHVAVSRSAVNLKNLQQHKCGENSSFLNQKNLFYQRSL